MSTRLKSLHLKSVLNSFQILFIIYYLFIYLFNILTIQSILALEQFHTEAVIFRKLYTHSFWLRLH